MDDPGGLVARDLRHVVDLVHAVLGPHSEAQAHARLDLQDDRSPDRPPQARGGFDRVAQPALRRARRRQAHRAHEAHQVREAGRGFERVVGAQVGEIDDRLAGLAAIAGEELELDATPALLEDGVDATEFGLDPARARHLREYIGRPVREVQRLAAFAVRSEVEVAGAVTAAEDGIQVGIRLAPRRAPGSAPLQPAHCVEAGRRAEAVGLDWVGVGEDPRALAGVPGALPVCAAMASATERIGVATWLLPLPLHHPVRLAEEAATIDALSNGRLMLGFGLGAEADDAAGMGLDPEERATWLAESVEILRQAWGPEPVDFVGRHFRCEGVDVHPKPFRAGGPPLALGTRSAAGDRRAAELGLGRVLDAPSFDPSRGAGLGPTTLLLPHDAEGAPEGWAAVAPPRILVFEADPGDGEDLERALAAAAAAR